MLRVFRKIRQGMVNNNQFSKYLLYTVGEIFLVVIGILIALQINNWNQAKKDERALHEYLVKIKSHTREDIRKLDTLSVARTQFSRLCKMARVRMLDKTEDENLILFMQCGVVFADFYFKPSTGGYEALKNSGYFGKINNTPLDSLLTRYHSLVDDIAENERSYNEYAVNQEAYLARIYDTSLILATAFLPPDSLALRATPQSEYIDAFTAYTSSVPYRNVISLAAFQFDAMVYEYNQLKDVGYQVINEIDKLTGN